MAYYGKGMEETRRKIAALPKAELHLHLEGSIEPETLRQIDPSLTADEIAQAFAYERSFAGFLGSYVWVTRRLTKPEHYAIAARRLLERLEAQNVLYAEITLSAGVVLRREQDLGAVYDALWRESMRSRVKVFWIPDAVRQFGAELACPVLQFALERRDDGVIAFGIGGDEVAGPAEWFRDVFARARDGGLRLTCHAGETAGPESIWAALAIGAERIGHGVTAIRDPRLIEHLRVHDVPLEVCLSSNVYTGVVASIEEHPAARLHAAGAPIVLNTDDPALFQTSLQREYELATDCGLPVEDLAARAFHYAFGWKNE